jgi:colanic acid/amylovoran biosynthesis glycosyltransferase
MDIGVKRSKITKLPVGVDLNNFAKKRWRDEPCEEVCVLTIARLVEVKGLQYSLKAFARVKENHSNIRYFIVGEGPLRNELENLAYDLDISDSVEFLGWKDHDEIKNLYNHADVFLLTSISADDGAQEGQGLVLLEAQAMKIPVVATRSGGIPECVLDNKSGFLVHERDINELAEKLSYLIDNIALRHEMGCEGRKYVENYFNIDSLNNDLVEIYMQHKYLNKHT